MKIYLTCLLLVITSALASAQKQEKGQHHTNLSVLVLQYHESLTQLHWLNKKGEIEKENPVNTSTSSILAPLKYKGPKELTLCSIKGKANPDGEPIPIAKVTLPESKNTIIILIPNPKKKAGEKNWLPYRAVSIDDTDTQFTAGSRLVFNLTNDSIRGITGTVPFKPRERNNNRFIIAKGKSTIISSLSGKTFNQVYLEQYDAKSKKWQRFKSSRWFHTPNRRKFIFIYQLGNTPPRVKIISQNMAIPLPSEGNGNPQ